MRWDSVTSVEAPLVFVGYGIVAPEYGWNDYAGIDVKGKIVAVMVNDPGLHDPAIFKGKVLTYYGRWTYKYEEAARQGAAGVLLIHTEESATYPWGTVEGSYGGRQVRLETAPTSLLVAGWVQHDVMAKAFAAAGANLDESMTRAGKKGFAGHRTPHQGGGHGARPDDPHRHLRRARTASGQRRPARRRRRSSSGRTTTTSASASRWTATRSTMVPATTRPAWARCSPSRRR